MFSPFKLLTGNREEIEFKLELTEEHLHHSSVEPQGGLLFSNSLYPYTPNSLSKGSSRSDRNVKFLIDPPDSIGVRYWRAGAQMFDPIYQTPMAPEFAAPFITEAVIKYNETSNKTVQAMEFGHEFSNTATGYIAVNYHYRNDLPEPEEGDLIEFWSNSWYTLGTFFNIIKVSRTGRIHGTDYFTVWELELERNESFVPERRLLTSGSGAPYVVLPESVVQNSGSLTISGGGTPVQKEFTVTSPGMVTIPLDVLPVIDNSQVVFVNGLAIKPGEEYVIVNGSDVEILCPLNANDEVMVIYMTETENVGISIPGSNC